MINKIKINIAQVNLQRSMVHTLAIKPTAKKEGLICCAFKKPYSTVKDTRHQIPGHIYKTAYTTKDFPFAAIISPNDKMDPVYESIDRCLPGKNRKQKFAAAYIFPGTTRLVTS